MAHVVMEFWRVAYEGTACLEYSWVPAGLRRVIVLSPGQQEGVSHDTVEVEPSHVQVYVTTNEAPLASLVKWQFPPGGPHTAPIVRARVELHTIEMVARGTVWFKDGTSVTDSKPLEHVPRPCPSGN